MTTMNELILDSLQRRMAAMHSLYYQAVDTMDLEHVNHFERDGVLPIAFSLFHYTNMEDASFMVITGIPPVWNESWQDKVQLTGEKMVVLTKLCSEAQKECSHDNVLLRALGMFGCANTVLQFRSPCRQRPALAYGLRADYASVVNGRSLKFEYNARALPIKCRLRRTTSCGTTWASWRRPGRMRRSTLPARRSSSRCTLKS